jgi:hypothetical protein
MALEAVILHVGRARQAGIAPGQTGPTRIFLGVRNLLLLISASEKAQDRPSLRHNAALAVSHIGAEAKPIVPALVKALQRSQHLEVRQFAAEALAQMRYPANQEGVPAIREQELGRLLHTQ